jgi:hypothetical protein
MVRESDELGRRVNDVMDRIVSSRRAGEVNESTRAYRRGLMDAYMLITGMGETELAELVEDEMYRRFA